MGTTEKVIRKGKLPVKLPLPLPVLEPDPHKIPQGVPAPGIV